MRYGVDVLNASKNKVAELSGMVKARLREKVNDMALLTVETIEKKEWEYIIAGTSFFRLRNILAESYNTFRVKEVKKLRSRERPSLIATGRHILADTAGEVFSDAVNCVNYLPGELTELVLAHSTYNMGTVEPNNEIPFVRFEYESVWKCLLRICSLTGGELSLDEENGEVDILNSVGGSTGVVFRYGLNLNGAERTINTSRLANRVYGVGGGNPPLNLVGATSSGGNKYASDATSIAQYGVHEATYHEPTLEEVVNLVATPALDGTYTGGLCENWTNHSATLSKNTNPDYYLYGRASQRVQTTGSGQGIKQDVTVNAGTIYSLLANIILSSGTVRVQVSDGTSVYKCNEPVTGTGLATIRIENWKTNNSTITVKIIQEDSGTANYYVDSVQVSKGARTKPFTIGKSVDVLWNSTMEYLNTYKYPEITYDVDFVDFYEHVKAGQEAADFGLGDTVAVIDPTLSLNIETRVMERGIDILRPWRVNVKLDSSASNIADVFEALRKAQEEGIKYTRAAMAESSTAAETGSTRLGFKNKAFRFYGTITVDSWNSLSWGTGTLRVGDAYYEISSGSATGLSASSTYYFYFDRTSPTTLDKTTAIGDAEGEDRIHLFAVTTTTSPTPCNIYPLGIVHA
ncbi:MAG: hypothetical protein HOC71_06495 [Candidatus Latescibacteria bacterium]|jgi:hypothetical protein|nr:hypothetical protein [Candidatus Latescibacterota bacterium]